MKRFSEQYPGYAMKGLKFFKGEDGQGLNVTILYGGKSFVSVVNGGSGGPNHYDWLYPGAEGVLQALVETKRLEIPPERKEYGMRDRDIFCLDIMVEEMANAWEEEKRILRALKKKTLFEVDGKLFQMNTSFTAALKTQILKRHPGAAILNESWVACG